MIQTGVYLDLPQEAVRERRVRLQVREHHFHGVDAMRDQVADAEHASHATATQDVNDFIIADRLPYQEAHSNPHPRIPAWERPRSPLPLAPKELRAGQLRSGTRSKPKESA